MHAEPPRFHSFVACRSFSSRLTFPINSLCVFSRFVQHIRDL